MEMYPSRMIRLSSSMVTMDAFVISFFIDVLRIEKDRWHGQGVLVRATPETSIQATTDKQSPFVRAT
jgi:hypothetical protein